MNKPIVKLLAISLATLGATACQSTDDPTTATSHVRISTTVNNLVASRTAQTYTGTSLGIFLTPADKNSAYTYSNVKFTQTNSTWSTADGTRLLWHPDASVSYTYSAYAPASDAISTDGTIAYNLSTNNIDLLYASGSGSRSTIAPQGELAITFDHVFAQFAVEVTIGTSHASTLTDPAITFTNAYGAGSFNPTTGELSNKSEVTIAPTGTLTAATASTDAVYTTNAANFAPGEQAVNVAFSLDGKTYTYTLDTRTFEAGKRYTLKVKLGSSTLNLSGITVTPWKSTTDSNISTH
jgi:hypothetical protein